MDLKGKKINFLGDSITEGVGVSSPAGRYDSIIAVKEGIEARNYGVGGTRIAYNQKASDWPVWDLYFCGRVILMNPDADAVVVFGGTNDYGHGDAPFGDEDDRSPATFCGALNWLMSFLKSAYPSKPIVFMTPIKRQGGELPNQQGHTLREYSDAIKNAGHRHGICVLDLYDGVKIDPDSAEERAKYIPDGLHPNDAGHKMIAELLAKYLLSI